MNSNPVLHWTDHAGERQAMPLADVKREFERFLQWRAQQTQPADHTPVGPEVEAAVDKKLGIVLLPPIRVSVQVHAMLQAIATARGMVLQAVVREALEPGEVMGAQPAASREPAPKSALEHMHDRFAADVKRAFAGYATAQPAPATRAQRKDEEHDQA